MNTFFQPNELEELLKDLKKKSTCLQNPYELFIDLCKQYPPDCTLTRVEVHHS